MAHILSACPVLAQTKYLGRHDAILKVLIFEIIFDLGLIDTVPPWYSPIKPQSFYETAEVQAYWDVPVYGEYQELRANRVDATIVYNRDKQGIALEMSCSWVSNRDKKTSEMTMKYAPLRWELKQRYPGYEIKNSKNKSTALFAVLFLSQELKTVFAINIFPFFTGHIPCNQLKWNYVW